MSSADAGRGKLTKDESSPFLLVSLIQKWISFLSMMCVLTALSIQSKTVSPFETTVRLSLFATGVTWPTTKQLVIT